MCDCEKNVYEEIRALDIDKDVKERILGKVKDDKSRMSHLTKEWYKAHNEIQSLRKAIIALSKLVGENEENYEE